MPQYIHNNEKITVPKGKCWNGLPVSSYTDEQLAEVGLSKYVPEPAPPYVPTVEERIQQLDQACRAHIDQRAHWTAAPMIWEKASANKPKSKAIKEWTEACWAQYYTNKAMLEAGALWDDVMLIYPEFPAGTTVGEAMQE